MAYLEWTEDLNTGIDVIDAQHRRIVDYINQLHDARQTGDVVLVGEVIESMVDYTLSHFGFEETLMEDAGYEFVRPHKKVHELFVRRVDQLHQRFKAGEDISGELHAMLSRWLFSHIRHDDASYVSAVQGGLRRLVPEKGGRQEGGGWLGRTLGRFFSG